MASALPLLLGRPGHSRNRFWPERIGWIAEVWRERVGPLYKVTGSFLSLSSMIVRVAHLTTSRGW